LGFTHLSLRFMHFPIIENLGVSWDLCVCECIKFFGYISSQV